MAVVVVVVVVAPEAAATPEDDALATAAAANAPSGVTPADAFVATQCCTQLANDVWMGSLAIAAGE